MATKNKLLAILSDAEQYTLYGLPDFNARRSQNRIESYHQLRSAIAHVGGKKELIGWTDIEI